MITLIKNSVKTRGEKSLKEAVSIATEEKIVQKLFIKIVKIVVKNSKKINKNDLWMKNTNYKNNNINYQQRAHKKQNIPFIKVERSNVKLIYA